MGSLSKGHIIKWTDCRKGILQNEHITERTYYRMYESPKGYNIEGQIAETRYYRMGRLPKEHIIDRMDRLPEGYIINWTDY